jgi:hypothetical protein
MFAMTRSRLPRVAAAVALTAAAVLPVAMPTPAHAWWRAGFGFYGPGVVFAPPVVVAPPPVVYAPPPPVVYAPPPVVAYAAPAPGMIWVGPHWAGGYWIRGHWGWRR